MEKMSQKMMPSKDVPRTAPQPAGHKEPIKPAKKPKIEEVAPEPTEEEAVDMEDGKAAGEDA